MIFGIGVSVVGYAIFYWGLHHFNVDCGQADCGKHGNRYGLGQLLGIPTTWLPAGKPIQLSAGGRLQPELTADTQTQSPENTTTPNNLGGGSNDWISGTLAGIGAPNSPNNQAKLNAWNACEGNLSGHSGLGINNPFNITADSFQPATHGSGAVNSAGVQSFSTMTQGIAGTVAKLSEPFSRAIVQNLQSDGSFSAFAAAVGSSGWGTSGSCIASKGS